MSPLVFFGVSSLHLFASGGDDGIRTHDPLLAGQVLSQLSYTPICTFPDTFGFVFCFPMVLQNRTTIRFPLISSVFPFGFFRFEYQVLYAQAEASCLLFSIERR